VRNDQPRGLGRILELACADRSERQVAERAAALPALETSLGEDALGFRSRVEAGQRLEPVDTREPMPSFASPLRVEKVVGKCAGVLFGETERADPLLDLHGGEHTYAMVPEAKLDGGIPQGEGWFVVNARDSRWLHNELGA